MKNAGSQGVENMGSPFLTNKHLPAYRFATKRAASNFFFFGECPPTETCLITLPQWCTSPGYPLIPSKYHYIDRSINQSNNQSFDWGGGVGVSEKFFKQFIWAFFAFAKTNFLRYHFLPLPPPLKNNGQFLSEVIKHAAWIRCDNAT